MSVLSIKDSHSERAGIGGGGGGIGGLGGGAVAGGGSGMVASGGSGGPAPATKSLQLPRLLLVTDREGRLHRFHGSSKAVLGKSDSNLRTAPCWLWFPEN